jgi:acetylornithine deacetylase/succinyl-diaminopimelate desuccinylase-like protein
VPAVRIPVIVVGGISNGRDTAEMLMAGASAVQVCTEAILRGPMVYAKIAGELNKFLDEHNDTSGDEIRGLRPGTLPLLDGHIDKVPVPDESKWTHAPYGDELADGRIYGRGTSDMKGAVAAMATAAAFFATDAQRDFAGTIYVAGVVYEECFGGIATRIISARIKPDFVMIGESSEPNLKRGQRGRPEIPLAVKRTPIRSEHVLCNLHPALCLERIRSRRSTHAAITSRFASKGSARLKSQ